VANTTAYGVNTVSVESVEADAHVFPNKLPSGEVPSEAFDKILSKAELEFWDHQMESPQTGLKNLAEEITYSLSGIKSLRLSMDRDTQRMVVRVVDKRTGHVVRQLPSKQMVDLVQQMRDLERLLFKASS